MERTIVDGMMAPAKWGMRSRLTTLKIINRVDRIIMNIKTNVIYVEARVFSNARSTKNRLAGI